MVRGRGQQPGSRRVCQSAFFRAPRSHRNATDGGSCGQRSRLHPLLALPAGQMVGGRAVTQPECLTHDLLSHHLPQLSWKWQGDVSDQSIKIQASVSTHRFRQPCGVRGKLELLLNLRTVRSSRPHANGETDNLTVRQQLTSFFILPPLMTPKEYIVLKR